MSPKRHATKLPKPLEDVRRELEAAAKPISSDGIASLSMKSRNSAFSSLNSALKASFPDQFQQYQALKSELEKRQWLAAFILDPAAGCSKVSNTVKRTTYERNEGVQEWLTEEQLAGPSYLNSTRHASIAKESMDSRRFSGNEAMAKEGIMQYNWTKYVTTQGKGMQESAELQTIADLEPEDVSGVREALGNKEMVVVQDNLKRPGPGGRQGKGKRLALKLEDKEETPLSAEGQAKNAAVETWETSLKQAKSYYDKLTKELGLVTLVKQKLATRGWGQGPIDYLNNTTEAQTQESTTLFEAWAEGKSKTVEDMTNEALLEAAKALTYKQKAVEVSYNDYRKNVLADFDKLR